MLFCLIFFFFKQKTAYEMRISDWSSDVCSSDLVTLDVEVGEEPVEPRGQPPGPVAEHGHHSRHEGEPDQERVDQDADGEREADQIGRASCRERVCQYV